MLALTGALFLMVACASEETNNNQEQAQKSDTKGLTAFVVNNGATRTTADYDGSGLNFYWTEGDHLWVNDGTLVQDANNDIANKAKKARFNFSGTYTAHSYPVRYTGKGNTVGDKVTIKSEQLQRNPNDASHIGESGDCGTAVAVNWGGDYEFALDHKAAYLTLLPYSTINFSPTVALMQVKITADEALSGQFNFNDSGIDLASRPAPTTANRSITLTLDGRKFRGFAVPVAVAKETTAAIMVLAPGTYNNVSIEYTLYDRRTRRTAIVKKEYATLTFTPGKNKKISTNLQMPTYITPVGEWQKGLCPNTHQAMWYIYRGDPHLDLTSVYAAKQSATSPASICLGGLWMKKYANIPGFNANYAPDGHQYSYDNYCIHEFAISLPTGKPANTEGYFFLPSIRAMGIYVSDLSGGALRYWLAEQHESSSGQVFAVDIKPSPNIGVGSNWQNQTLATWTVQ